MVVEERNQQVGTASDPRDGSNTDRLSLLRRDRRLLGDDAVFRHRVKGRPYNLELTELQGLLHDKGAYNCSVSIE